MGKRALSLVCTALLGASVTSCFPELPDATLVDNLRVLAVQSDPANANFASFPPPVITVTALVVDPGDEDLSEATHTWSLDLPEDVDLSELEGLLPEGPYGTQLVVDLFGRTARDEEPSDFGLVEGVLPLRYRVETPGDHREAVKLVSFFLPDLGDDDDSGDDDGVFGPVGDDDDSAGDEDDSSEDDWGGFGDDDGSAGDDWGGFGDDDDSAGDDWGGFGDDDDASGDDWGDLGGDDEEEEEVGLAALINENPRILSIQIDGGTALTAEAGQLPGLDGPLYIGEVSEDGSTLTVVVDDDEDEEELDVQLYRTRGCPNLKPEEDDEGPWQGVGGGPPSADDDPCAVDDGGTWSGFSSDEDVDWTLRDFEWRPLPGESSVGTRLFLVLRDERGGQSWQELRPEVAPD